MLAYFFMIQLSILIVKHLFMIQLSMLTCLVMVELQPRTGVWRRNISVMLLSHTMIARVCLQVSGHVLQGRNGTEKNTLLWWTQPTCTTWDCRKNKTHLYDLGAQEGGVNECRQVKHLHAVPHRGRQLAHLVGSAQDAGSVAQVVGVAAPRVHTVTGGHCHLQVKHSEAELWTGKT